MNLNLELMRNHKCNWPGKKPKAGGWICRGCLQKFQIRKELFSHQKNAIFTKSF